MTVNCKAAMTDKDKKHINEFQSELFKLGDYQAAPKKAIKLAETYLNKYPDLEFISGWGTPTGIIEECSKPAAKREEQTTIFDNLVPDKLGHGGKRKGAGRKAGVKSKVVRVPEPLEEVVSNLVELYKSGDWDNASRRQQIAKYIEETVFFTLHLYQNKE
ncbi:hypothetical protein L1D54_22435 [Vibrio brasiliensis]|uniref:hypothetical protein n=1 Tax=Vibrio brasiliensis TaxID=170652 RepID=UPI001EFE1F8F|nr:hypothetical protein [Vibrio brasiliensis]MCG9753201.1 hypothetical protein [Vibrio brasiliensis]